MSLTALLRIGDGGGVPRGCVRNRGHAGCGRVPVTNFGLRTKDGGLWVGSQVGMGRLRRAPETLESDAQLVLLQLFVGVLPVGAEGRSLAWAAGPVNRVLEPFHSWNRRLPAATIVKRGVLRCCRTSCPTWQTYGQADGTWLCSSPCAAGGSKGTCGRDGGGYGSRMVTATTALHYVCCALRFTNKCHHHEDPKNVQ